MLSDVELDRYGVYLSYADCSAFDEQDCGASIGLSAQSVCKPRELELLGSSGRLRGFRGVPLEDFGGEGGYYLYSGRAVVTLGLESSFEDPAALRRLRPALPALRPYPPRSELAAYLRCGSRLPSCGAFAGRVGCTAIWAR